MSHQHFGLSATSTGSPPGLMPQLQMLLDEFFTYTKGYSSKLVRWDFSIPFLGQFVCFLVAWYSLMPGYSQHKYLVGFTVLELYIDSSQSGGCKRLLVSTGSAARQNVAWSFSFSLVVMLCESVGL